MPTRIYLDCCCLNRPFDDRSQIRIRLESESVLLILSGLDTRDLEIVGSEILDLEVDRIPDPERRQRVEQLLTSISRRIELNDTVEKRAIELEKIGFQAFDALHLASAEVGEVDVLLTTDDKMMKRARRMGKSLKVRVDNPLDWLQENW